MLFEIRLQAVMIQLTDLPRPQPRVLRLTEQASQAGLLCRPIHAQPDDFMTDPETGVAPQRFSVCVCFGSLRMAQIDGREGAPDARCNGSRAGVGS